MAEARQRSGKAQSVPSSTRTTTKDVKQKPGGISILDIARTIVFLLLASGLVSWFVTGNDFFWGHRPTFTNFSYWQNLLRGERIFTDAELKQYDGSNPDLPIYLALNGSVYDVSAGRRFYGPGGSYSFFSGPDNTRSFVTSCFDSPPSSDLRDVERMHLPISTKAIDAQYTSGQLKSKKEQEMRIAKKKVQETLEHWVKFFSTSDKYPYVGRVRRSPPRGTPPELCQKAIQGRPIREPPSASGAADSA